MHTSNSKFKLKIIIRKNKVFKSKRLTYIQLCTKNNYIDYLHEDDSGRKGSEEEQQAKQCLQELQRGIYSTWFESASRNECP